MLNRLKKVFNSIVSTVSTKTLSRKELEEVLNDFLYELIESDVAYDVAEDIIATLVSELEGTKVKRGIDVKQYVQEVLKEKMKKLLTNVEKPEFENELLSLVKNERPVIILMLGINGVGKTTTIAKVAYRYTRKLGLRVVISASDTFRAGAQEQLEKHARNINVPIVKHKYGSDPAAVAYDTVMYAKSRGFHVVIVDTAGRMHTDSDLMDELRKISRVVKPHYKILIVDALTGNDAIEQAKTFNEAVGIDGLIVTKVDADVKGGVIISLAHEVKKPILYVGTGQGYEDLDIFTSEWFIKKLFQ